MGWPLDGDWNEMRMNRIEPDGVDLRTLFVALARAVNEREELIYAPHTSWWVRGDDKTDQNNRMFYPTEEDLEGFPLVDTVVHTVGSNWRDAISLKLDDFFYRIFLFVNNREYRFCDPSSISERVPIDFSGITDMQGGFMGWPLEEIDHWRDHRPWLMARDLLDLMRYRFRMVSGSVRRERKYITADNVEIIPINPADPFWMRNSVFPPWGLPTATVPQGSTDMLAIHRFLSDNETAWEDYIENQTRKGVAGHVGAYVGHGQSGMQGESESIGSVWWEIHSYVRKWMWLVEFVDNATVIFDLERLKSGGEIGGGELLSLTFSEAAKLHALRLSREVMARVEIGPSAYNLAIPNAATWETEYLDDPALEEERELEVPAAVFGYDELEITIAVAPWVPTTGTFLDSLPFWNAGIHPAVTHVYGISSEYVVDKPYYDDGHGEWWVELPTELHGVIDYGSVLSDQTDVITDLE